MGIPQCFSGEESTHNARTAGDASLIPGSGKSPERTWKPTPVFLPGEFREQKSLASYSPWDCKELDTTEVT